jgi:hypothetical protein
MARASGKKGVESRVSGIKNVLTVLAVAISKRFAIRFMNHRAFMGMKRLG